MKRTKKVNAVIVGTMLLTGIIGGIFAPSGATTPAIDADKVSTNAHAPASANAHTLLGFAIGYADTGTLEGGAKSALISGATTAPVAAGACMAGPGGCTFGAGYLA